MKLLRKYFLISLAFCFCVNGFGQNSGAASTNDFMLQNGKIYVVIAVITVILIGLFAYLFNLDRKISKLEKKKE